MKLIYLKYIFIVFFLTSSTQVIAQTDKKNSLTLGLENDLLAGSKKDADYTGGFMFGLYGPSAASSALSLDPILSKINSLFIKEQNSASSANAGLQLSMQAWTPYDKQASHPLHNDRPYASLLALTSTRISVEEDEGSVWASSISAGLLGAGFAKDIHSGFHRLVRSGEDPKGYANQISSGGEPTLLYSLRRQSKITDGRLTSTHYDFKWGLEGRVGYLSEATLSIAGRIGGFSSPWWSMQAERSEFYSPRDKAGDLYMSLGLSSTLRAYNALLQGQFRNSAVTIPKHDLEFLIGEFWLAVTHSISDDLTINYKLRYQTPEIKNGAGARSFGSGGIYLNFAY